MRVSLPGQILHFPLNVLIAFFVNAFSGLIGSTARYELLLQSFYNVHASMLETLFN